MVMNKAKRLDQLVGGIEDLLARLPDGSNPEILALRDRVDSEIFNAWTTISRERAQRQKRLNRAASRPVVIIGLALLAAASLLSNRLAQSRTPTHR
jgi:hypothetical protein